MTQESSVRITRRAIGRLAFGAGALPLAAPAVFGQTAPSQIRRGDELVVGIWGGATLEAFRGRGIYRALTAARAASALRMGKRLVHSDSTEDSRPILERSGLVRVSTTTPYDWRR